MKFFDKKLKKAEPSKKDAGEEFWHEIIKSNEGLQDEVIRNNNQDSETLRSLIEEFDSKSGNKISSKVLKTNYEDEYSEDSLFEKISKFAQVAGEKAIYHVFVLYYCLIDSDTPASAKATILGSLGYFIIPTDAIPDFLVGVGYTDDLGILVIALKTVLAHIKEDHRTKASEQITRIFGQS